jgi:hypothetical protein
MIVATGTLIARYFFFRALRAGFCFAGASLAASLVGLVGLVGAVRLVDDVGGGCLRRGLLGRRDRLGGHALQAPAVFQCGVERVGVVHGLGLDLFVRALAVGGAS